ncbi:hypothetical protein BD413DRAFT_599246 [Trametes elegans]|nr:hypothetical protein BD413DRAFT_599246 [Trametes elegans]
MSDDSLLTIEVLVLFVETLLFGGFAVLYPISVWILMYRERRDRRSRMGVWMFATVTFMFLLALVHLAFDLQYALLGFVKYSSTPGGPEPFYKSKGDWTPAHTADPILFAILTLSGDSFMTYRVYLVWERKIMPIILPMVLILGTIVSAVFIGIELYGASDSIGQGFYAAKAFPAMIAYFVLTLLTNSSMTFILLWRVLRSVQETRQYRLGTMASSVHWKVMRTIIQSELAYSIAVVLNLAAYVAHSNLVLVTFAALPPLVGISFTMIITRIGLSEVVGDSSADPPMVNTTMGPAMHDNGSISSPIAITVHIARTTDDPEQMKFGDHTQTLTHVAGVGGRVDLWQDEVGLDSQISSAEGV